MELNKIAKEMASKYEESTLRWVLSIKRLEHMGYLLIKESDSNYCPKCGKKLMKPNIDTPNNPYCFHCTFGMTLEKEK